MASTIKKPLVDLLTFIPIRCTSSGRALMADCSLMFVPVLGSIGIGNTFKAVSVICAAPLEDELEDIYQAI